MSRAGTSYGNGRFTTFALALLSAILIGGGGFVSYQATKVPALQVSLDELLRRLERIEGKLDKIKLDQEKTNGRIADR